MRIRKKQEELIEVVDREEQKETLWYHFDDMTLRNGILYLRGWYVSVDGPGEVRLTDASGEEISGVSWMPQGRPDLETAFPDEKAVRCGFTAQIPRESLPAGMVTAEFSNASSVKKEEIPLRRLDRENTRLGKLCSLLRQNGKKKNLELIRQNGFMNYCRYLDEETDIEIITASTMVENLASANVLRKNGFTLVVHAVGEDWGYKNPTITDKWIL